MAQKNNYQFSIRDYTPSDEPAVRPLFRDGVLEHVYPAFFKAMSNPDHVGVALSISMAGYVLGGSSYFQALLFGGAWAGLVYYCCHEIHQGFLARRLSADMADVQAGYLGNPDNGFWVAEADVNGQSKVVGMVAVTGRRVEAAAEEEKEEEEEGEGYDDCNGGVAGGRSGDYGELSHVVVAFPWRRSGLGSQLTRKALEFCGERGYARLALEVSSPQTAAAALCQKLGFAPTASHSNTHANRWFSKLARIDVTRMEKLV